jgi:hypothetical protein
MWLQMSPHFLGSNTLVQKYKGIRQTRSAEPSCLGNPLLDLLEVSLENLRSEIGCEVLRECSIVVSVALR